MADNVFKRKTKVIDDEDNEENEKVENKVEQNFNGSQSTNNIQNGNKVNVKSVNEIKSGSYKNNVSEPVRKGLSIEEKIKLLKSKEQSEPKEKKTIITPSRNIQSVQKNRELPSAKKNIKRKREESESERSDDEESEDSSFRSEESDSGSSDRSSSEESSESEKKSTHSHKKKKHVEIKKSTPVKRPEIKKVEHKSKTGKVLKTKSSLVNQLLKRWWFALPQWPPEDFDPSEKLRELKLRHVSKFEWKLEPLVNDKGLTKCIELDGYKFVYVDPSGKVHDLRPKDSVPSFNNFINKSEKELYSLLIKALSNQINQLETGEKYCAKDIDVINSLKEELTEVEANYKRIR